VVGTFDEMVQESRADFDTQVRAAAQQMCAESDPSQRNAARLVLFRTASLLATSDDERSKLFDTLTAY